ncbi:MAG: universal stress protein [Betaproteobacteria bacterium]
MKRLLIPVDGSANSLNAVRSAINAWRAGEAGHLLLVNVQPRFSRYISRWISRDARDRYRREQSTLALAAARELATCSGAPFTTYMMVGPTERCVADLARDLHCNEILVGASPQGIANRFLNNSLAVRLMDTSFVPVKVIPGEPLPLGRRVALPVGLGLALLLLAGD